MAGTKINNTGVTFSDSTIQYSSNKARYPTKLSKYTGAKNTYFGMSVIMSDGLVAKMGWNGYYQLGMGGGGVSSGQYFLEPMMTAFPYSFPGAAEVYDNPETSQTYGNNACIDVNGQLWTWGRNYYGGCGNGYSEYVNGSALSALRVPYNASTNVLNSIYGKTVVQVVMPWGAESADEIYVRCSDGTVHAAGYNGYGQRGNGTTGTYTGRFYQVSTITNATSIFAGRTAYCKAGAVTSSGQLYMWGYNANNDLGNNNTTNQSSPVLINSYGSLVGKTVTSAAIAMTNGFAVCSDGTLHAWGNNNAGQLGDGGSTTSAVPKQVNTGVASVYTGGYETGAGTVTFILKTNGTVWYTGTAAQGWLYGPNAYETGYVDDGEGGSTLVTLTLTWPDGTVWRQITGFSGTIEKIVQCQYATVSGGVSLIIMTTDGKLWGYGSNNYGVLGTGKTDNVMYTDGTTPALDLRTGGQYSPMNIGPAIPATSILMADISLQQYSGEPVCYMLSRDNRLFGMGASGGYDLGRHNLNFSTPQKIQLPQ